MAYTWGIIFDRFCIDTTLSDLSFERGAIGLLNVGRVDLGEFSLGRVVLFPLKANLKNLHVSALCAK